MRFPQGVRHSADTPRPLEERPPSVPQRARTLSTPARPPPRDARFKDLPPHPGSKDLPPIPPVPRHSRQEEKMPERNHERPTPSPKAKTSPKPKKNAAAAPKPPELEHIPQLLPLFVEMMRPQLMVRRQT
ncbi:hypothetical protein ONZ51_g5655 [Trametes cubensis]|uniref:Uncharacterized protein n=1 Tax=Trametes cubensis TaxID=1111947 RepID=A0AAD7XDE6_9APHY|nr:hypothetical protein ONZ51_g5655 [Trametes cubensis]